MTGAPPKKITKPANSHGHGAKAKANPKANDVPFFVQPPFDKRMTQFPTPGNSNSFGTLKRGYMVWDNMLVPAGYAKTTLAKVKFLYNPSTIGVDFALNITSGAAAALEYAGTGQKNQANLTLPLSQSSSFSLLFDRTFELWGQQDKQTKVNPGESSLNDPAFRGVGVDILAMQQFTGMLATQAGMTAGGKTGGMTPKKASKGQVAAYDMQGPFQMIPSWLYFGAPGGVVLFGYVSAWDYQITHWTQNMIPMRCVIDVSYQLLPMTKTTLPDTLAWAGAWSLIGIQPAGGTTPPTPGGKPPKKGTTPNPIGTK